MSINDSEDCTDKEEQKNISKFVCGPFWQNTSADFQCSIIFKVLKRLYKSNSNLKYNDAIKSNNGSIGDEKFIISAKWWREWCDYVNFESIFEIKESELSISSRSSFSPDHANNYDSNTFNKVIESDRNNAFDSTVYLKPGKI